MVWMADFWEIFGWFARKFSSNRQFGHSGGLMHAHEINGGDPRQIALAALMRKQTTVSNQLITERLRMACAANVRQRLRRAELRRLAKAIPSKQNSPCGVKSGHQTSPTPTLTEFWQSAICFLCKQSTTQTHEISWLD